MDIQPISARYRGEVNAILKEEWACPPSVSRGKAIDTTGLPGFVSLEDNRINGIITYNIENSACEIVTLNSFEENRGVGTALINAVCSAAKAEKCTKIWLITTNDDIDAIRFCQRKGFAWIATRIDAIEVSRKLKPSIPLIGRYGIPIKHELEFERKL
ncbi:MAG: GNAT family N-acetyltransferase [Clostridiaceae bacterium]|nr:GNAT family N-acetyltransferase [Eubacteriales bacterium]